MAKVDERMALVDKIEAQLAASRTAGAALLDSLAADLTKENNRKGVEIEGPSRFTAPART